MGNFGRDNNRGGRPSAQRAYGSESFSRGGFGRNNDRGGFGGGRSSFGGRSRPSAQRAYGSASGFSRRDDRGPREMFKTTCSNCGKDCEVPFRPTNGKPVYCSDCFEKMGNGGRDSRRPDVQSPRQSDSNINNFEALNVKLDKIISLLESNNKVVETPKKKEATKESSKK